jgi:flagellar biosynthesis/type III secretory pathway chaperone
MSKMTAFLSATERCVSQSKAMLEFEQEKRQALLSDDLDRLEDMIQAQQAAIMKLESLEKQRIEAQEKAGYHNMSAEEILERMDEGDDKAALSRHVGDLRRTLDEIRYQNGKSLEIARANLQIFNTLATGKEVVPKQGVYKPTQAGGAKWQGSTSFETKI